MNMTKAEEQCALLKFVLASIKEEKMFQAKKGESVSVALGFAESAIWQDKTFSELLEACKVGLEYIESIQGQGRPYLDLLPHESTTKMLCEPFLTEYKRLSK